MEAKFGELSYYFQFTIRKVETINHSVVTQMINYRFKPPQIQLILSTLSKCIYLQHKHTQHKQIFESQQHMLLGACTSPPVSQSQSASEQEQPERQRIDIFPHVSRSKHTT